LCLSSENNRLHELEEELKRAKREIERLKKEKESIEKEKESIEKEKESIEKEKESIEKEFEHTKKEFEEFKAAHAGTVRNLRKALHIKPDVQPSGRQRGAQPRHKGYGRRRPVPDETCQLALDECPCCGHKLVGSIAGMRSRIVHTLHMITPARAIEYLLPRRWCPRCKKLVEPDVPDVLPYARFNLTVMLLVMYLHLALRVPGAKICEYFRTLHGLHISEGEIPHMLTQLALAYGPYYSSLERAVKLARVKYTDSTSWRIDGKNHVMWVFVALGRVLYKVSKTTSHKTPLRVLGKNGAGKKLVVDRHSAYRTLARRAGYALQFCWSHILDDSKELAACHGREGLYVHRALKRMFAEAKSLNHRGTPEQVDQLQAEVLMLAWRHYKSTRVRRFVNGLAYRDLLGLFLFVTDPDVDSTNNISERKLRHLVMIRRISHGSRSQRGARVTAMLASIIQTLRLNRENVLQGMHRILFEALQNTE